MRKILLVVAVTILSTFLLPMALVRGEERSQATAQATVGAVAQAERDAYGRSAAASAVSVREQSPAEGASSDGNEVDPMPYEPSVPPPQESDAPEAPSIEPSDGAIGLKTIRVLDGGSVRELELERYVAGTTAAEMLPSFPTEALRAQAVAARSLALYRIEHPKHGSAAVCLSAGCCTAFREPPENESDPLWAAAQAAYDTAGVVATYDGRPIMATFFAGADGATVAAADAWGGYVPYLTSVSSPDGKRSGHGVGMSQCGAAAMAEDGADYTEILKHYYSGVEVG